MVFWVRNMAVEQVTQSALHLQYFFKLVKTAVECRGISEVPFNSIKADRFPNREEQEQGETGSGEQRA